MARRPPHFTLAGVPVRVEPVFFVVIAVLGINPRDPSLSSIASWVVLAFVSVLVHELGHAVAFRAFGVEPEVTLHGLGGVTSGTGDLTPWRHIVVSLAGPLTALVLLGLPALALDRSGVVGGGEAQVLVSQALWINIGWSLLNLIPILPLDGGQVFAALVDLVSGGRARHLAEVVSLAVAVGLGIWGLVAGFVFVTLLAAMFAYFNVDSLRRSRQRDHGEHLVDAQRLLLQGRPVEAEAVAHHLLRGRPSPATRALATELAAWARLAVGDAAGAAALVRPGPGLGPGSGPGPGPGGDPVLGAALALAQGRTAEGVTTMAWALSQGPPGPSQALGAMATARAGQVPAVAGELVLLGPPGLAAAERLRDLLVRLGATAEAAAVDRLLTPGP